ncbi:major facilitator family transporter [Legionella jordanis]|uniref:Lysosomal dipeptide transporter MFSD1 n=3 Tax=Legionella jordanis TaxID=456 RepID=A0A0W0V814_9GAMM|nr:MFS transporter [Legionella jordanis]KTD16232.1 major facilitator family transporter [Legionella jordanis]VEH12310.1 major facilitator family transporter [Legionella jordanis]
MFQRNFKLFPILMWALTLSFFTYQFILRLWPGLMMHQIMGQFSIDASHFGLLAALYYYGYSGMQIPAAILLERFKIRYVVASFVIICGLATLMFTYTNSWYLACISRFLVGAGSAIGFLAVSKVISQWFSKDSYAKMIGFSFSIGLLGAIYGGKPISMLIEQHDWQSVAFVLTLVSLALGFCILFFLRSPQTTSQPDQKTFNAKQFKEVMACPSLWVLAIANFMMVGSLEGFADVWGVPYLITSFAITKGEAAQLVSFIFVGMLFGGPILAFLSKKIGKYTVISLAGLVMALSFKLLLSTHVYHSYGLACLFLVIGMMCCYQVIIFAAGADLVQTKLLGVSVAFLNCVNMLGGSFFHSVIGHAMDATWSGAMSSEGVRQYNLESYQMSLQLIPYCAIAGACLVALIGFHSRRRAILQS